MSVAQIADLKRQIQAAHARGDRGELERLQTAYRMHPGVVVTAAGRGHRGGTVSVRPSYGVDGNQISRAPVQGSGWPRVTIAKGLLATLDGLYDGGEAGGYAFGQRTEDSIHITRFESAQLERSARSVTLDLEHGLWTWAGLDSGVTLVGDWHVHPSTGDRLWPSGHDVECWEASSREFSRPWIGIVCREADVRVQGLRGRWQETTRFEAHATVAIGGRHRWIEIMEEI